MSKAERPLAALLGKGAAYSGEMSFEGRVRVDGTFKGKIFTDDTLEIGQDGTVEGEVDAAVVVVAGTISGSLRARERLVLQATGVVRGEVDAAALECVTGARIEAKMRVGG